MLAVGGGEDAAGGHHLNGDVDYDRAGMKEVERPHVHGAAGKIDPAGGAGDNASDAWENFQT